MGKKSSERLEHALHNESVCDHLALNQQFSDWIITTAFYTSLQFVSHKLFPYTHIKGDGKKAIFDDLDEYVDYRKNVLREKPNKHRMLADLVAQKCASIASQYEYLLDLAHTARYVNYQQPPQVAIRARSYMLAIKKFCH